MKHLRIYAKVTKIDATSELSAKYLITACFLLAAACLAHGEERLVCDTSLIGPTVRESMLLEPLPDDRMLQLEAGRMQAQLGENPTAELSGGVLVRSGTRLAGADRARYEPDGMALVLDGNVRYEDTGTQVTSSSARFAYGTGLIRFDGAEFSLGANNARGTAQGIQISQDGRLELDEVGYTTCPRGSEDWILQSKSIDLDTNTGIGTARGVRMRFKGVPVLYAPYISFPISDARKTGVLTPEVGSNSRSGTEIIVPFYWNIAPNYDATITPRLLSRRGLQVGTEFRYLTQANDGIAQVEYLPDDSLTDESRHQMRLQHRTLFANGWRNRLVYREVSDNQYFEDLGGSQSSSSITHLDRNVRFDYFTDTISVFAQVQDYQTLDDAISASDQPYRRVPQLLFDGRWPEVFLGLDVGVDAELVNFDRDVGVTGWRANIAPRLELPIERPGWFVIPAASMDYTQYELSDTLPGQSTDPSRSVPVGSVDAGLVLERTLADSDRLQTIEPRMLYVHIPFRDQDDLPVFDTIMPDLNLVQLFRENRFVGGDRIGDTDQVSVGVTSRILDFGTGEELFAATIGQTRYLSERAVSLPGEVETTSETSDYIAEVRFLLYENLNFDFGHQWGTGDSGTEKSQARLQYRPANDRIVNLAYRFRRDALEQGDLSWIWPLSTNWNFVGRYNFSFRDDEVLDQFFGLEYESCCWGLRLVSRRFISRRDGTRESSVGLQLVLKGMTSVGTAADRLLENGILGYSSDLR